MRNLIQPVLTIAGKDIRDALKDRFIILMTAFLLLASLVALAVAAIALKVDVATYAEAKAGLIALGKDASTIPDPAFYPLKLLRGFVEHVEIIGAIIGILIGYRAAASERGRQTLALIVTRPISQWQFLAGKVLAGTAIISSGLILAFVIAGIAVIAISGIVLNPEDIGRLAIVMSAAGLYALAFFLLGFVTALWAKKLPNALLLAFTVWLSFVLIAPQIGDTLDPDNQVAGGVFKQLQIAKPQQVEILQSFSTYETIRNGIEVASPTKHFERLSFAVLGIKDTYAGQPLMPILAEKASDLVWLLAIALALGLLLFARRLDPNRLSKE
ncbi:ABC transporter permease subunit [Devosia riboflavina]|uniref:ABC transporter permease subunit n=1 Tax=Devosia riboflavina TaxID=46914 RepID=UPI00069250F5|nr:ABC transporter permease subunit [Devosia riboflavina]